MVNEGQDNKPGKGAEEKKREKWEEPGTGETLPGEGKQNPEKSAGVRLPLVGEE